VNEYCNAVCSGATDASNPRKISAGRVSVDPPPALTFIKPAIVPTAKSRSRERISSINNSVFE